MDGPPGGCLTGARRGESGDLTGVTLRSDEPRVLIGGYGRVGHTIAVMLQDSGIAFMTFDTDLKRVAQGKAGGHQVVYAGITDPELLATVQVERVSLVVLSYVSTHSGDSTTVISFGQRVRHHQRTLPCIGRFFYRYVIRQ